MRALVALFVLSCLAACQAPPPEASPLDRQAIAEEVRAVADEWIATAGEGDLEATASYYLDDLEAYYTAAPALFVNRLSTYPDGPAVVEAFGPAMANRSATQYNLTSNAFAVLSADAVVQVFEATYNVTNLDGETGPDYPMTGSVVWVRHQGSWKLLHYHQSWSTDVE